MKRLVNLVVFLAAALIALSCEPLFQTRPNRPYEGPFPEVISALQEANPKLAEELLKLPEFQDGISASEAKGLENLFRLYEQDAACFDRAFAKIDQIGRPEFRKYSAPLQALYWVALKGDLKRVDLADFSLVELLNEAWYKSGFEYGDPDRWNGFGEVTDRLNSPELIDFYESRSFSYKKIRLRTLDDYKNPRILFERKQGECWLFTAFSVYCLTKAGYEARAITVFHGNSSVPNHVTCLYTDKDGKERILDNTLRAYIHTSGIYEKEVYLDNYPYYGEGYVSR
ncbi:MAG: hypothetical protein PVG78_12310 [Desulfobacterales bacterium]|jgi:hypothetical protein